MSNTQIGRLAMREEGDDWVAYYAMPDTMVGALRLGSIRMAIATDEKHKQAFMALMREAVGDIVEEMCGTRPVWPTPPQPAPQHERAGRA